MEVVNLKAVDARVDRVMILRVFKSAGVRISYYVILFSDYGSRSGGGTAGEVKVRISLVADVVITADGSCGKTSARYHFGIHHNSISILSLELQDKDMNMMILLNNTLSRT
jgi:hypothetical protein